MNLISAHRVTTTLAFLLTLGLGATSQPVLSHEIGRPHLDIGPKTVVSAGVTSWSETLETTSGPVEIKILEVQIPEAQVEVLTQPGTGRLYTGQRPNEVDERLRKSGLDVVASMNADFWASNQPGRMYRPIGLHVTQGILATTTSQRSAFLVSDEGDFQIGTYNLDAHLLQPNGSLPIADLNNTYTTEGIVLMTAPFGAPMTAYTTRPLVMVSLAAPGPRINQSVDGKVESVVFEGSARPSETQVLLAWNHDVSTTAPLAGTSVTLLANLQGYAGSVQSAVGGGPRLVRDGKITAPEEGRIERVGREFMTLRHPRSALGYSKDGKTIWFVVVDGRRPGYSVGINLRDLARQMVRYGAYQAINLDGGGSSALVIQGEVVNRPSDKTVRPVTNTIHLVRKSKSGGV